MDKVILDSFDPDPACFSPHLLKYEPDLCTLRVEFHTRENPEDPQPTLLFQRDKGGFIFSPTIGPIIPKLIELGIRDDDENLKASLYLAISLRSLYQRTFESYAHTYKYKGPDVDPFLSRATDFLTSGDLKNPDRIQKISMSKLIRDMAALPENSRELLKNVMEDSLTRPDIPKTVLPRIQWVIDHLVLFQALDKTFSSVKDDSLRTSLSSWTAVLIDFLNTGETREGDWGTLQKQLDELTILARHSDSALSLLKDLFAFFLVELENPYGSKGMIFSINLEAKTRLKAVLKFLRRAVEDHRAELIGRDSSFALEHSLRWKIMEGASNGFLASLVEEEMKRAPLEVSWIKKNIAEIAGAILPALSIKTGEPPRIKADYAQIAKAIEDLTKKHFIQKREYHIAILALLRFLFGPDFSETALTAFYEDRNREISFDFTPADRKKLETLQKFLGGKISSPLTTTRVLLPFIEGAATLGGSGFLIFGGLENDPPARFALMTTGSGMAGAGLGALACHYFLRTRNPFISDGICAAIGALIGIGASVAALHILEKNSMMDKDGRTPVTGYGP